MARGGWDWRREYEARHGPLPGAAEKKQATERHKSDGGEQPAAPAGGEVTVPSPGSPPASPSPSPAALSVSAGETPACAAEAASARQKPEAVVPDRPPRATPKQIALRLDATAAGRLANMAAEAKMTPAALARSLVVAVLEDDARAHAEKAA